MKVQVAVADVVGGPGNPVCVRHGLPVAVRKRVRFVSSPPAWSYVLIVAGLLIFLIVAAALRKTATAPAWGYCDRCRSARSKLVPSGWAVLVLAVLGFVAGANLPQPDGGPGPSAVLLMTSGFVLLLVGLGLVVRGGWTGLSRGVVSRDGGSVTFASASPGFEGWVRQLPADAYQRSYGYNAKAYGYDPEAYARYLYGPGPAQPDGQAYAQQPPPGHQPR